MRRLTVAWLGDCKKQAFSSS